ncbi:hypothetical protein V7152_19340 [Neobacillus drentensis]|uniref:hypothetical protein n=1 Tax=Neobacillus drentensis TaxID=220684 RepID=UPI002FFDCAB0
MGKWTLDKFRETFFELETSLNLLNQQIMGVYFWKLVRADIITYSRGKLVNGEVEKKEKVAQSQKKEKKNPFIQNPQASPLYSKGEVDYIILDRGKKTSYKEELVDIFTYDIEQEIKKRDLSYLILDFPFMGQYFSDFDDVRKNIESVFYFWGSQARLVNPQPTEEENLLFQTIPQEFKSRFGFDINEIFNFRNKILAEIKRFKFEYLYYFKVFIEKKPKKIFTTIYYRRHAAVEAAKILNIPVVDIQYANININHPAYGFPAGVAVPYFPNEIIVWGDFFKEVTPVPNNANVIVYSPSYYKETSKEYNYIKKQENLITFASQHSIGEKLFELAFIYANNNPEMDVIFRLHPGELGKYEDYKYFNQAMNLNNFKLSTKDTDELHGLLAKSQYQVGVFSTTMIEGILHRTNSIFVNISGVEEYQYIYENNFAPLINNEKELQMVSQNYIYRPVDIQYFFNFVNSVNLL